MRNAKLAIDKILGWFCIIIFSLMVILTTYQVIVRYVFSSPSATSETLTRYAFVWLILYSSAYVFGQRDHININFVKQKQSIETQKKLNIFIEIITIVFAALVMIYGGIKVTSMNMLQIDSILNIPTGVIYSCIPIAGIIIIFYSLYNIMAYNSGEIAIDNEETVLYEDGTDLVEIANDENNTLTAGELGALNREVKSNKTATTKVVKNDSVLKEDTLVKKEKISEDPDITVYE